MGSKEAALGELKSIIKEAGLARSTVGREIANDPSFMDRMEDDRRSITTKTLDDVHRYVLKIRHQLELDLEKKEK